MQLFSVCFFTFQNQHIQKSLSGKPSCCQTLWIQIRPDIFDLGPKCLQKLSAEDTSLVGKENNLAK